MKKVLLLGFALVLGLAVIAQVRVARKFEKSYPLNPSTISADPVKNLPSSPLVTPTPNPSPTTKSAGIVNVITLGTAANGLGWGYGSGAYEHLWADDDLKAIMQIHRMGPGASPPSFSGYLAGDHAANMGQTAGDWLTNYQIYAATLNTGGTYYADAARYPQGGLYNPAGNNDLTGTYLTYFAPNFLNPDGTNVVWGGYSYGSSKWGSQGDTLGMKHLDWYNPPPSRNIPEGYTVFRNGVAWVSDREYQQTIGYDDAILIGKGVWDEPTKYFHFTYQSIPAAMNVYGTVPINPKIEADPSENQILWLGCLGNLGPQLMDSTYYPIFWKSTDGGNTWDGPISVVLDGPSGPPAILNYMSDYRLEQLYGTPIPPRDQIAYTSAWDFDFTVDVWGNPHAAVVICVPGGGYSIYTPDNGQTTMDSTMAVFDIYSIDKGTTWCAREMGVIKHYIGQFPDANYPIYNNSRATRSKEGAHVFISWNDTYLSSATYNNNRDIIVRGWDLVANRLTNSNSKDQGTNATYLSDVTQNATCGNPPQIVFTGTNGSFIIPFVCESFTSGDISNPVTFKYCSNFTFYPSDYTIDGGITNCPFPTGITQPTATSLSASVYPNPVKGIATLAVVAPQSGNLTIEVTNLIGQKVMKLNKGNVAEGNLNFNLDASQLTSGVYFFTVTLNNQKATGKMIVE